MNWAMPIVAGSNKVTSNTQTSLVMKLEVVGSVETEWFLSALIQCRSVSIRCTQKELNSQ
jgi:hypothetical protein